MYAVVQYNDYRKEQHFEVITTTDDVDYAKKVAFQYAKNSIPQISSNENNSFYKINTRVRNEYLRPINKTIIAYRVINVKNYKKKVTIQYSFTNIYAVIELDKDLGNIEEIDTSLICDNYKHEDDEEDEEDDE
jgi:hypothetical protein